MLHGVANWVMRREYGSLGNFDVIDGSYGSRVLSGWIWDYLRFKFVIPKQTI